MAVRTGIIVAALVLMAAPAFAAPAQLKTATLTRAIDDGAPKWLKAYAVPGASVALIRGGKVVWTHAYGQADVATHKAMSDDAAFNVGSLSKMATAWGVMALVERGQVDLDAPVDTYLKRWRLPASGFDNAQVTVRRLLSHTSGISNHDFHGWDPASPLPPVTDTLSGKSGTGEVGVIAAPGSGFHYSGANYSILQLLIEDVTGQDFAAYMDATVFRPLGMTHTRFGLPDAGMATPYDSLETPLPILRYNEYAAAGLTTTLPDLARFAAAGMDGAGVLKPRTVRQMQTIVPGTQWAEQDPYGPAPQYGLGHSVRSQQFAGHTGVGHGGSNSGWESFVQIVPETGDGIVITTNSSSGSAVIASALCAWRQWAGGKDAPCPAIDIRIVMYGAYRDQGLDAAIVLYERLRRDAPTGYDFAMWQLNSMGYTLMRRGDVKGAIKVFELNARQYPQDGNAFDSLAEAYLKDGQTGQAIAHYRKSLELNPHNDNARNVLKSLGAGV